MIRRLSIFGALLLCACMLLGQADRAALTGTIRDASGATVGAATITITAPATGYSRATRTAENGQYSFPNLPVGVYQLSATKPGFQPVLVQDLTLGVGQRRTEDVTLPVGAATQTVTIEAEANPVDQSTAEVGTVISTRQLQEIPQNGRNWTSFMLLAPGAINTGEGNQNSIRFLGRSRDDNNWTIDGVDATGVKDPRQEASLRLVISQDSIAEFRVQSALYTAETGNGAGAQVNVVSKSGSNSFHGSVFEYLRNSALDARRPIDPFKPDFRLNQFGGNVGGPLRRDRTFFFANYEGLRQVQGVTQTGSVPSAAFRARALATNPALRPIIDAFPAGTARTSNADIDDLFAVGKQRWTEDSGSVRIDHHFTDRLTMFGRYNIDEGVINQVRNALLETRTSNLRTQNGVLQLQQVYTPTFINETKFGVNRSPLVRISNGRFAEQINIPGFTNLNNNLREVEAGTSYSIIDNISLIRGTHTIKAGFEARRIQLNLAISDALTTRFATRDDFLANRVDRVDYTEALPTAGVRRTYWFAYLQDEWRIKSNLTLNIGARYEFYSVPTEVSGRGRVFDLNRCQGFCAPGTPWYFPDRNNIAPRISLAWSPTALKGRTVVRAGFGQYYGPGQADDVNAALDSIQARFRLDRRTLPDLVFPAFNFIGRATGGTLAPRSLQRDRQDGYANQYTLSIQQQLPGSVLGEIAYVGSQGHHLFNRTFTNLPDPVTGRFPLPAFAIIDEKQNYGNSSFNGLTLRGERRFSRGLSFGANYMWSHNISDNAGAGDGSQAQNPLCRRCERADADWDIRHNLVVNSVYELPFLRNSRWGGWQLSGIGTARTGRPFNVSISRGSTDTPFSNTDNQRPNLVPGVNPFPAQQGPDLWLNRAAFAAPARGTYGNLPRNAFRAPGLWQADVAVTKRTKLTERTTLDFRVEAFNLFNRAQYGLPQAAFDNAGQFGRILSVVNNESTGNGGPRQVQLMLRLNF